MTVTTNQSRNDGTLQESSAKDHVGSKRGSTGEEEEDHATCRRKRFKEQEHRLPLPMDDLPDSLLQEVFGWVGKGEYLFVASVSPRFRKEYSSMFGNDTLYTAAFSSIPRA